MKLVEEKQKVVLQEDFFLKGEKKKERSSSIAIFECCNGTKAVQRRP